MRQAVGFHAAVTSLNSYHTNWMQAVRSGNRAAQQGALLAMAGSGGLVLTNGYGFISAWRAALNVIWAAKGEIRDAAWKASGHLRDEK